MHTHHSQRERGVCPTFFRHSCRGLIRRLSTACFSAGRDVYKALGGKIPIGMVASMWGGTPVEAWSTQQALAKCPTDKEEEPAPVEERWASEAASPEDPDPHTATVLWNGMIAPLLQMQFKVGKGMHVRKRDEAECAQRRG